MAHALIVGGGYAGVAAARALARVLPPTWLVTLIERRPGHELLTRLPQIVVGALDPDLARIPYGEILPSRVTFVHEDVLGIDLEKRTASTTSGIMAWDSLFMASGVEPWIRAGAGEPNPAFPVRSVQHASALRDTLIYLLKRRVPIRVIIIGAGYTGSEVAGELLALADARRRIDVTMLADASRVLPQGNARLARLVDLSLRERGAHLHLGVGIAQVRHDAVTLVDGRCFPGDCVIWAGETRADERWGRTVATVEAGRLPTDSYLQSSGVNVFAIGDVAAIDAVPANAQLAVEEGRVAAENLARSLRGEPSREFRPHALGEVLTLGPRDGVAEILGVIVSGRRAHAVKSAALARYLFSLGGVPLVRRYAGHLGRG